MPRKKAKVAEEPVPEPEPEEEEEEEEEEDEGDEGGDEDNEQEEEEEVEEEEGEDNAKKVKRLKRSRINERRKARQNGIRSYAEKAGAKVGMKSFGNDMTASIFSQSDVKRLAQWCPSSGDVHMTKSEFETHLNLRDEPLSTGPLTVLGANVESFARKIISEVVLRNIENGGAQTINAANMKAVLRPFLGALHSDDFIAPGGVIRIAQQTPVGRYEVEADGKRTWVEGEGFLLPKDEDEDAIIMEERKFAKANQVKMLKEKDKAKEAASAERAKKRAAKAAVASKESAAPLAIAAA